MAQIFIINWFRVLNPSKNAIFFIKKAFFLFFENMWNEVVLSSRACKSIVFINISPCTKFFLVAMTYHLSNGKENYNNWPYKKKLGIFLQGSHLVECQNLHFLGIFERSEPPKKFRKFFL